MAVFHEIRAEETRLCGAGLLDVPSVLELFLRRLLYRCFSAPVLRHSTLGGEDRSRTHCGY